MSVQTPRKPIPKWIVPLIIGSIVAGIAILVSIILLTLHLCRNTEQAQLAYDYVVSSEVFQSAGLSPEDLRMNEFSVNHSIQNGERTSTAEITFTVRRGLFRKYAFCVTCHKEGEHWSVCEECSRITVFGAQKSK